jgi:hypothetical protein
MSQYIPSIDTMSIILLHDIFHIGPGISPPVLLSGLIWESWADTMADMENVM